MLYFNLRSVGNPTCDLGPVSTSPKKAGTDHLCMNRLVIL